MDATTERMLSESILSKLSFINDQKTHFFIFIGVLCCKAMIHSYPFVINLFT